MTVTALDPGVGFDPRETAIAHQGAEDRAAAPRDLQEAIVYWTSGEWRKNSKIDARASLYDIPQQPTTDGNQ
ncbi:hypothetical protein BN2475_710056 [Paraburkholderia ribeironis]|uniref:Uncharacterized protein n=1 Tax=Paraburkholderia ribeironis TaxID=1247936 RepID=A0A1N7SIC9_9BURK|nr:hypothetical protein BN2475_710056 [Paraburkholderia ribeironis]